MKLIFESLDALLTELRDRNVDIVRVSPALAIQTDPRAGGLPYLVGRVLVTAALDDRSWAEWRLWVGRALTEDAGATVEIPAWLTQARAEALARVSQRIDDAGFRIREGIVTHDAGTMDSFRL